MAKLCKYKWWYQWCSEQQSCRSTLGPDYKVGDYVLVEYVSKRKVHYVGKVSKEEDEEGDLEVSFFRRHFKVPNGFIEPTVEDIHSVPASSVLMILSQPIAANSTKRVMSIRKFSFDFSPSDMA